MAGFNYRDYKDDLLHIDEYVQSGVISVNTVNPIVGQCIPCEGNVLILVPRLLLPNSSIPLVSAAGAQDRVYLRFNRQDAPAIPFSFIANSSDQSSFAGVFKKIYIDCLGGGAGSMYFIHGIGIGVGGNSVNGGSSANGYAIQNTSAI